MKLIKATVVTVLVVMQLTGCTSYKSQYVAFRPPEAYVNKQEVGGVAIGAEAYADKDIAYDAFGFDIRGTGLLPVQLVMNNLSGGTLQIVTDQTFLVDAQGGYWPVIPNNVAVDRVEKSTQLAAIGKGAGAGALLGAAGGAILGAAIGIVSGQNVGVERVGIGQVIVPVAQAQGVMIGNVVIDLSGCVVTVLLRSTGEERSPADTVGRLQWDRIEGEDLLHCRVKRKTGGIVGTG